MVSAIEEQFPKLSRHVHRVALIEAPTPVHRLAGLGKLWNHDSLYIKREDQTHVEYGGNKVRNLEFVLGDALHKGATRVLTLVPYGSNFSAALCLHARRVGLAVQLTQFVAQRNVQIEGHVAFCREQQASILNYDGLAAPVLATMHAGAQWGSSQMRSGPYYWITPGASNVLGALGHANAFLEFTSQRRSQGLPEPEYLVVGAGTCGTIAGLTAASILTGSRTRILGVRCAEKIVCNASRVRTLVRQVLRLVSGARYSGNFPFEIRDVPSAAGYAVPSAEAFDVMRAFWEYEHVSLDTTYTAKVGLFLSQSLQEGTFRGSSVLYWHTYSPAIQRWTSASIDALLNSKPEGLSYAIA